MKAIAVKYFPASGSKPSFVKAFDSDKHSVKVPFHTETYDASIYEYAAQALCNKMGWIGKLVSGGIKINGKDYEIFCFVESHGMQQKVISALTR
jgi:hypothetical protein